MRAKESLNRNLMRLSEQLLELVSGFKEASKNFTLDYFTKRQLKTVKTISAHSKSNVSNFLPSKKYSSCDTIPLIVM
jgi:hypothetical protein